jgi:hypothetical protein
MISFYWHLEGQPDPDPLVRGLDQRIWIRIRTKMSWIRNMSARHPCLKAFVFGRNNSLYSLGGGGGEN